MTTEQKQIWRAWAQIVDALETCDPDQEEHKQESIKEIEKIVKAVVFK